MTTEVTEFYIIYSRSLVICRPQKVWNGRLPSFSASSTNQISVFWYNPVIQAGVEYSWVKASLTPPPPDLAQNGISDFGEYKGYFKNHSTYQPIYPTLSYVWGGVQAGQTQLYYYKMSQIHFISLFIYLSSFSILDFLPCVILYLLEK